MDRNDVAFVIGHNQVKQGYYSPIIKKTEYEFNTQVGNILCKDFDIYYRKGGIGYISQMEELAKQINPKNYKFVISLHFNMFDGESNKKGHGCETIIYPGNQKSRNLSNKILTNISTDFDIRNRGVKEHGKGERGYGFLSKMRANAIILEPFFGDESEAKKFSNIDKYTRSIIKSLL